jgi:hypothetical protein
LCSRSHVQDTSRLRGLLSRIFSYSYLQKNQTEQYQKVNDENLISPFLRFFGSEPTQTGAMMNKRAVET